MTVNMVGTAIRVKKHDSTVNWCFQVMQLLEDSLNAFVLSTAQGETHSHQTHRAICAKHAHSTRNTGTGLGIQHAVSGVWCAAAPCPQKFSWQTEHCPLSLHSWVGAARAAAPGASTGTQSCRVGLGIC